MATARHLGKAPIVEAILDLRVALSPDFELERFVQLQQPLRDRYPIMESTGVVEGTIQFQAGRATSQASTTQRGFIFKSEDGHDLAQYRIDGFTFNKLKPYSSWKEILPEAKQLWGRFVSVAKPCSISRLALRYINRLGFPLGKEPINKYLTSFPMIPEGIPSVMHHFLTRVGVSDAATGIKANITQTTEEPTEPNSVPVILDIDVFMQGDFPVESTKIWEHFERLHEVKNAIFFGSITEETARLYE